ncbi:ATP-binding protein [Stieleria sp. JC731]|uniref:AlbA family DNA-binding domain-containing protein n=1 Tax=Pirellulaceae TaxID=2691357 RepID=UPI001E5AA1F6|nr:ATP-binding protein [Stieleria sp. JC731]MCC9602870.1 ATP-binding protein [Stieleria sp. JC731]
MADEAMNPELDRYILETGESDKIDAKGPMGWDGGVESAGLAKDIAAFANSKDGGVIVIGKSESDDGSFALDGVSDQQSASFETTKVATWVNNRFSPPIGLVCHTHRHTNKKFVIITIDEFSDVPHLCTKTFQDPANAKKLLLREKTIYVRTANAESAPLGTIEELRTVIGLATAKRGQEMLAMFNSMLSGNPLIASKSSDEQFEEELSTVTADLGEAYIKATEKGVWVLSIRPSNFNQQLFDDDAQELEERIRRNQVRLRSDFPPSRTGTHMRDWGLCNDTYRETWGLTTSGQFILLRPYYENEREFECPWRDLSGQRSEPILPPGKWLDVKPSLLTIAEFFAFAERFVGEYGVGERVSVQVRATSINGRHLVTTDGNINRDMTPECRANQFTFTKLLSVEEFRATWEELAAQAMKRFSDIFPDTMTTLDTMEDWVDRFKHRQY